MTMDVKVNVNVNLDVNVDVDVDVNVNVDEPQGTCRRARSASANGIWPINGGPLAKSCNRS